MSKKRVFILLAPVCSTPLLALLIADGYLNLGAGEKDLLLLIPWLLWSILFIVSGLLIKQELVADRVWLVMAFIYSILPLLVSWLSLYFYLEFGRN